MNMKGSERRDFLEVADETFPSMTMEKFKKATNNLNGGKEEEEIQFQVVKQQLSYCVHLIFI